MTMHLMHAGFTTTGHKKAKKKFASSEQKRQHEQLEQEWAELKRKHASRPVAKVGLTRKYSLVIPAGRGTAHIPSKSTGVGVAVKADVPVYTGNKIKGIGTMHKSNAVPVFSDEEAVEISKMRRG
jgi:CRISPR/Cas system CMR subunit Cmr6 (Cas7 group RAMP superfamily)